MTSTPLYFLGIDGGGTKCRARLRDARGALLGEGLGGPANIRLGLDLAWGSILDAADGALAQAGLDRDALDQTHAGLGLAGLTNDDDRLRTRAAGPRFAGLTLETDAHTACLGAFSGRDGAILITGTGSAGYALVQGRPHIVGGWGFEVSDEGSGASIGRDAVRAALRGHDGLVAETALTRHVRAALGPTPAAIVAWADRAKPADYGKLAPEVLAFAAQGDLVAIAIIGQAVANLESYMHRLVALGAPRLCLMGGLAQPLTPWLSPWAQSLLVEPEGDALEGSLLLARFGAGTTPSPRDNPNISR